MKAIILFLFLLLTMTSFSQTKFDTVVRKKYLDSVKNQLATYTVGFYTYLNLYDRTTNERDSVIRRLNNAEQYISTYRQYHRKSNIRNGIVILGTFILSFITVAVFNNN